MDAVGQKIARLTPLSSVMAALDELARPVEPREVAAAESLGFVLADDVFGPSLPSRATVLTDGWAVRADELPDASSYAPVRLANPPTRVEAGDELPAGADAVAPLDIIVMRGDGAEAVGAVTPGEGVALPGTELDHAKPLLAAGKRVRPLDVAVLETAGVQRVSARVPRILLVAAREDLRLQPALHLIAQDCVGRGGERIVRNEVGLHHALNTGDCDAMVIIGGSGVGRRDQSVIVLAKVGQVKAHGIGVTPGATAALGHVGSRPVLIVPGQLGGALAVWLTLGRAMLARLSGQIDSELPVTVTLSRKIPSTVGLAEFVPVRHAGTSAEPLAIKHLPLSVLSRANGWLLVPPESEGFPPGAQVAIYRLP
jgi:molybdopterin biosynthesis enzyme